MEHVLPYSALGGPAAHAQWGCGVTAAVAALHRQQAACFAAPSAATQQQLALGWGLNGARQQAVLQPTATLGQHVALAQHLEASSANQIHLHAPMPVRAGPASCQLSGALMARQPTAATPMLGHAAAPGPGAIPGMAAARRTAPRIPKLSTVQTYNPVTGVRTPATTALAATAGLAATAPLVSGARPLGHAQLAAAHTAQFNQHQLRAALQAAAYGNMDDTAAQVHSLPREASFGSKAAAAEEGSDDEDMGDLCRQIGTDLARHGIPVATAIEAGWLGRVTAISAVAIGQAYTEELERLRCGATGGAAGVGHGRGGPRSVATGLSAPLAAKATAFTPRHGLPQEPSSVLSASMLSSFDDSSAGSVSSVAFDDAEPGLSVRGGSFFGRADQKSQPLPAGWTHTPGSLSGNALLGPEASGSPAFPGTGKDTWNTWMSALGDVADAMMAGAVTNDPAFYSSDIQVRHGAARRCSEELMVPPSFSPASAASDRSCGSLNPYALGLPHRKPSAADTYNLQPAPGSGAASRDYEPSSPFGLQLPSAPAPGSLCYDLLPAGGDPSAMNPLAPAHNKCAMRQLGGGMAASNGLAGAPAYPAASELSTMFLNLNLGLGFN